MQPCPLLLTRAFVVQAAMKSQQSQLNLILEAVKSNPPVVSSSSYPPRQASESQVFLKTAPLPAEELPAGPTCQALESVKVVSWGSSKSKGSSSRRKVGHKGGGSSIPPSSGGAIMKDVQSCGEH